MPVARARASRTGEQNGFATLAFRAVGAAALVHVDIDALRLRIAALRLGKAALARRGYVGERSGESKLSARVSTLRPSATALHRRALSAADLGSLGARSRASRYFFAFRRSLWSFFFHDTPVQRYSCTTTTGDCAATPSA
jgi:hypothetical protein